MYNSMYIWSFVFLYVAGFVQLVDRNVEDVFYRSSAIDSAILPPSGLMVQGFSSG